MAISAADYNGRFVRTKTVEVEEGVEFEIRRISPFDMWDSRIDQSRKDSANEFIRIIIVKGTVNPKISDGKAEGAIDLHDLSQAHMDKLAKAILEFSGYIDKEGQAKADPLSQGAKP